MTSIVTITMNPALDESFAVDRIVPERKLRCSQPVIHPGGGGINVARAAARLGADVTALWIGGGANGQMLADILDGERIRHRRVPAALELRRNSHVTERDTGDLYRFVLPGPELSDREGAQFVEELERCRDAAFVVISGSLPPSLPSDYYARLAEHAPAGARVILDASGDELVRGLAGHVYLVKPNRNELGRLAGGELRDIADVVDAARTLIAAQRVEVVAVSLGADGIVYVTGEKYEHIASPRVKPVSTVGAGDSSVAGIVVGLSRGLSLPDAMRLGVAAGTAAVLTPGTELFRPEDTERLFGELQAHNPVV